MINIIYDAYILYIYIYKYKYIYIYIYIYKTVKLFQKYNI